MWQIKLILTDYAHLTIWASTHNESHAGMENQRDIKSVPMMTATPGTITQTQTSGNRGDKPPDKMHHHITETIQHRSKIIKATQN